MTDKEMDAQHRRREKVVRRACRVMGWEYKTCPVFTGIRKVAIGQAVPVGLEKLEAMLDRIEGANQ